jgi:predicted O-methyltransferase YrrM
MNAVEIYLNKIIQHKEKLFGLYRETGAQLIRKEVNRAGGTTWGYRLISYGKYSAKEKISGSSIGDDEIRIFYDICQLIHPKQTVIIGNGFGLSAFALALSHPDNEVVAIDNWSEGEFSIAARDLSLDICKSAKLQDRVHIVTGTSPQDTPRAMQYFDKHKEIKVDLAFIDGYHTNEAAAADYQGLLPYLDSHSIVLWHNVYSVREAFQDAVMKENDRLWDQEMVLRTFGPLGVYYETKTYPKLHQYFQNLNLEWRDWDMYLSALKKAGIVETITTPWYIRYGGRLIKGKKSTS